MLKNMLKKHIPKWLRDYIQYELYMAEMNYRKNIDIFDYKRLAQNTSFFSPYEHGENMLYGHNKVLRKYLNAEDKTMLKEAILHSIDPNIYHLFNANEVDVDNKYSNKVYIASSIGNEIIKQYLPDKEIIVIGNYMKYVDDLLKPEEYYKIKKKIGKTLLIFPLHSSPHSEIKYNISKFLEKIDIYKEKFNTILFCVYWSDILKERHRIFIDRGYKVVTAGCAGDSNFLSRLKSIIKLSDMVMSNGVGSHIGYTVHLNKPFYLFFQEFEYDSQSMNALTKERKECLDIFNKNLVDKTLKEFGEYKEYLTVENKNFVNKYWGN